MARHGTTSTTGFDTAAAVTRSMLGWGAVAGPFYLVLGLILALTRDGFDLARHPLSLLAVGPGGWMQTVNFLLTGAMIIVAGWGMLRALERRGPGAAVVVAGAGVLLAAVFEADPVAGFPPGQEPAVTVHGMLHLVAGGVEFVAFAVAAILLSRVLSRRGEARAGLVSLLLGIVVLLGFLLGGALAASPVGVALLWLAVVASLAWLLLASIRIYRVVPHPDGC